MEKKLNKRVTLLLLLLLSFKGKIGVRFEAGRFRADDRTRLTSHA